MGTMPDGTPKNLLVEDGITPDPALPPTAVDEAVREAEDRKWTPAKIALWVAISLLGGVAWFMLAIVRGETVNAIWFVFASVCTYLIGYRFYSKVIERYIAQAQRPPGHPRRIQGRRQGLRPHGPERPVRPPLRRHRRRRPPGGPGHRGPDGLPPRHHLDHHRRRPRRCRPGLPGHVLLHAPRRALTGPDGPRGTRRHRRHRRPDRHPADHGDHRRHPGPRRRQRPGRKPVGRLLRRHDHPDRPLHGRLPALHPARARSWKYRSSASCC